MLLGLFKPLSPFCSPRLRVGAKFSALIFLFCLIALAPSARGQSTFTVTRSDDRNTTCVSGVDCSLREAVNAANTAPTNDTINFASTVTTVTLTSEIIISNNGTLTITGTGADVLTISGGGTSRIFYGNGATLTISSVTLRGGNGAGATASGFGGAIFANNGTLSLNGVHVTANSTPSNGGGVYFFSGANHQILNSTFSANTALDCGGFFEDQGTLSVTNSTISGNTVQGANAGLGGGFCSDSDTTLRSVTITGNSASPGGGGGIYHSAGTLNLGNTIVAGNTGGAFPDIRFDGGTITTAGYNLIGDNSGVAAAFPAGNANVNNDIVGTNAAPVNPLLGPLQNNGGTTPTHALLGRSPAIDRGFSFGSTTDQRGLPRPVIVNPSTPRPAGGDGADIGAYEAQAAPTAAAVSVGGRALTSKGRGIRGVVITMTDSQGNQRRATTISFGYYRFENVAAGETYILTATGKRFTFGQNTIVESITGDTDNINFIVNDRLLSP